MVSFPILNYLSVSLRLSQVNQEVQLRSYAKEIETSIQGILPLQKIFLFPRSIIFKSALLDANNHIIFSLIDEPIPTFSDEFAKNDASLFYKYPLAPNILHAKFLVVQKEISHSQVIFDVLVIIGVVLLGMLIFLVSSSQTFTQALHWDINTYESLFTDVMHELKTPLGIMQLNIEGLVKVQRQTP